MERRRRDSKMDGETFAALMQLVFLVLGIGLLIWAGIASSLVLLIIAIGFLAIGGVWIIFFGGIEEFLETLHELFT